MSLSNTPLYYIFKSEFDLSYFFAKWLHRCCKKWSPNIMLQVSLLYMSIV